MEATSFVCSSHSGENTGKSQNMTLQDIQCLGGSGVVNNYHCVECGHVTRY